MKCRTQRSHILYILLHPSWCICMLYMYIEEREGGGSVNIRVSLFCRSTPRCTFNAIEILEFLYFYLPRILAKTKDLQCFKILHIELRREIVLQLLEFRCENFPRQSSPRRVGHISIPWKI